MSKKDDINDITASVIKCKKCALWKTRNNPVVGYGSVNANILFIGEAPGRNEDLKGSPFVGRAGEILDELLKYINLERVEVYITNILKCRPPNNRNPLKSEIKTCTKYLNKQIEIIQPKIIVTLGNFASSYIFQKFSLKYYKISKIHGRIFNTSTVSGELNIIPIYHPAVASYDQNKKDIIIKDFKTIKKIVSKG
jgi:DNA polymerase